MTQLLDRGRAWQSKGTCMMRIILRRGPDNSTGSRDSNEGMASISSGAIIAQCRYENRYADPT